MAFTGNLSQFSLPELFRFLEEGHKTGLLTISKLTSNLLNSNLATEARYIWLQQGRILAAADRLDNQGLISIITKRGWNNNYLALKDFDVDNSGTKITMGLYLKSQGIVKAEQLLLLFRSQIAENISPLFQIEDAEFNFESNASLPLAEMTGLSIPATEATLMGLRNLQEFSQIKAKLPDRVSSILSKTQERPKIRLEYTESQVLKYANGNSSLQKISEELQLPLEKVQQIAFRLIVSNLAEEVFVFKGASNTTNAKLKVPCEMETSNKVKEPKFHQSTQNLVTSPSSNLSPTGKNSDMSIDRRCVEGDTLLQSSPGDSKNNSSASSILHPDPNTVTKANMSQSFLQNLVGFLQDKI